MMPQSIINLLPKNIFTTLQNDSRICLCIITYTKKIIAHITVAHSRVDKIVISYFAPLILTTRNPISSF